jgi:hypothetical protein
MALKPSEAAQRSNRSIEYACTRCGRDVGRLNLKVRRVVFKEMGVKGPVVRSRTTDWLCVVPADDGGPSCLEADADWQKPALSGSPGMADTKLAKDQ